MFRPCVFLLLLSGCSLELSFSSKSTTEDGEVEATIIRHIPAVNGSGNTSPGYTEVLDEHGHVFLLRECFGKPCDMIKVKCEK